MRCRNCGKPLRKNVKFCTECGYYNDFDSDDDDDDDLEFEEYEEDEDDDDDEEYEIVDDNNSNDGYQYNDIVKINTAPDEYEEEEEIPIKKTKSRPKSNPPKEKKRKVEEDDERDDYGVIDSIDEFYIKTYIGEDYDMISKGKLNIFALFLNWMYFLYRKLYIIGIVGFIITGVVILYLPKLIIPYVILVMILCGLFFNKIYLMIVKMRIARIMDKCSDATNDELLYLCKKKGGVSIIVPLIIFACFLALLVYKYYNFDFNFSNNKFFAQNTSNQANCKSMARQAYSIVQENKINGSISEAVCNIRVLGIDRSYDIYFIMQDGIDEQYLYFENNGDMLILKANTLVIPELEKKITTGTIIPEEEDMLNLSKNLKTKYRTIRDDANFENREVLIGSNSKERTNFIISKDDILR